MKDTFNYLANYCADFHTKTDTKFNCSCQAMQQLFPHFLITLESES